LKIDEEVGGVNGMKLFSTSEEFKKLNVGLGLDEGIVENDDKLRVVWSERAIVGKLYFNAAESNPLETAQVLILV